MSSVESRIEEFLERVGESWNEQNKELARQVIRDKIQLVARQALGEDVSAELSQINSQEAQIAAIGQITASSAINGIVSASITWALNRLI